MEIEQKDKSTPVHSAEFVEQKDRYITKLEAEVKALRERLITPGVTIADLKKEYDQPKWCSYPGALDGQFGCWSLMDLNGARKLISPKFCKSCECFKSQIQRKGKA